MTQRPKLKTETKEKLKGTEKGTVEGGNREGFSREEKNNSKLVTVGAKTHP